MVLIIPSFTGFKVFPGNMGRGGWGGVGGGADHCLKIDLNEIWCAV